MMTREETLKRIYYLKMLRRTGLKARERVINESGSLSPNVDELFSDIFKDMLNEITELEASLNN